MSERPVPTYENGLAKLPKKRNCIGWRCPVAKQRGACFVDKHHVYFPYVLFDETSALTRAFHLDPHNIINMARCRHYSSYKKSEHRRHDFALIPPDDVMVTFLDESAILLDLGISVRNMAVLVTKLLQEKPYQQPKRQDVLEWLQRFEDRYVENRSRLQTFEVMPAEIVTGALEQQETALRRLVVQGGGNLLVASALSPIINFVAE